MSNFPTKVRVVDPRVTEIIGHYYNVDSRGFATNERGSLSHHPIRKVQVQWVTAAGTTLEVVEEAPMVGGLGAKHDTGKPMWHLLTKGVPNALAGVVRVLSFAVRPVVDGGKGYEPHSWKDVPQGKERYESALHRHLNAINCGELVDAESGESHWHHVAANALFLAELHNEVNK